MEVQDIKNGILDTLDSIDMDKLSICDLKTYAEILKIVSDTRTDDLEAFWKKAMDTINTSSGYKYPTISEMKGENTNG